MKGTLHKKINGWSVIYGKETHTGHFTHHELPLHESDLEKLSIETMSGTHVEFQEIEELYRKNATEYQTNWYVKYAKLK